MVNNLLLRNKIEIFFKKYPYVIGNDCMAGRFYQFSKNYQYNTPFVWNYIDLKNMEYLINNFSTINYDNVKFEIVYFNNGSTSNTDCIKVTIDNNLSFLFPHYCKKKYNKSPSQLDIIRDDIIEYTKNIYFKRLSRLDKNIPPLFVITVGNISKEKHLILDRLIKKDNVIIVFKKECNVYKTHYINYKNCIVIPNNLQLKIRRHRFATYLINQRILIDYILDTILNCK